MNKKRGRIAQTLILKINYSPRFIPEVENHIGKNFREQPENWFSLFLKYQTINTAFFEYILMEAENG